MTLALPLMQKLLRHDIDKLSKPEYQLLYVQEGIAQGVERNALKVITASENI